MRLLRRLLGKDAPGAADEAVPDAASGNLGAMGAAEFVANPERGRLIQEAGRRLEAGRLAGSLALIDEALAGAPDDAELLFARASTLLAWGRHREASATGARADALGCRHPLRYLTLGWISFWDRDTESAEAWLRKAVAADPVSAAARFGLGTVLQVRKQRDEAIAQFRRALELQPDSRVCRINIGVCLIDGGKLAEAELHFRDVIALEPDAPKGYANLGVALGRLDRYDEALAAFEHAERLIAARDDGTENFVNYAIHLRDELRTAEALAEYEHRLAKNPSLDGHYAYSLALLTAGRLIEGWHEYEYRWLREPSLSKRLQFSVPSWNGQDLRGKTVLISCEQGYGDTIQFARYAPLVQALGAKVLLQVQRGLEALASGFDGIDRVLGPDETTATFDFYVHSLSLPRVFATDLASIPCAASYLRPDAERVRRWAGRLGEKRKFTVGLVWAGNPDHLRDRYRSLSLKLLAPLLELEQFRFVSLQKGPAEADIVAFGLQRMLTSLGADLADFADAAAVVAGLDLVICVDTAIAHLAGALGKPVWLMLPTPADWRWLEHREDTPWYPTMRLFRQSRRMAWDDVVDRVKSSLEQQVAPRLDSATHQGAGPGVSSTPAADARRTVAVAEYDYRSRFGGVAEARGAILQYLQDDDPMSECIRWYGEYLRPQMDLLLRFVKPGSTVVEVGSGIGAHSVDLARAAGNEGHVFLYEANPLKRQVLEHNLTANRLTNVTVMRRALDGKGEMGGARGAGAADTGAHNGLFNAETLDELRLDRLTWLKTNEGVSASDILDGATESLWRLRPFLFLTASDDNALHATAQRVREFSYRCWKMETGYFNRGNFNRRENDIFFGQFVLGLVAIPEEIEVDVAFEGCEPFE